MQTTISQILFDCSDKAGEMFTHCKNEYAPNIGETFTHYKNETAGFLNTQMPQVMEKTNELFKSLEPISKTSMGLIAGGTLVGAYLAGRACCSPKLSTSKRVATLVVAIALLGAAAYETYANGVNFGLIQKIY